MDCSRLRGCLSGTLDGRLSLGTGFGGSLISRLLLLDLHSLVNPGADISVSTDPVATGLNLNYIVLRIRSFICPFIVLAMLGIDFIGLALNGIILTAGNLRVLTCICPGVDFASSCFGNIAGLGLFCRRIVILQGSGRADFHENGIDHFLLNHGQVREINVKIGKQRFEETQYHGNGADENQRDVQN